MNILTVTLRLFDVSIRGDNLDTEGQPAAPDESSVELVWRSYVSGLIIIITQALMKIEEVADCAVRMRFAENYFCLLLWTVWLVVRHYFYLQQSVLKMSKIL